MSGSPPAAPGIESARPARRLIWPLGLAAVTLLGAGLRFYDCGHPLWLDELHTSWCASGSFAEVPHRASLGNQPSLYLWLAWLVTAGTGGHEVWLRLPSLLAGTLLAPAVGWVGYRLSGKPPTGLIAAALVAIHPWFIDYAQEARCYALVQLVSLGHVLAVVAATDRATIPRRAGLVLLTAALFHLHYTALLILVGELTWYVLARRGRSRRYPEQSYAPHLISIDLTLALLLTMPGWSDLYHIFTRRHAWKAFVPAADFASFFQVFGWLNLIGLALVAAAASYWLPGSFSKASRVDPAATTEPAAWRPPLLDNASCGTLLACWFLAPLVLVWMLSYFDIAPLFYRRYLGTLAVVPPLAAAWLCSLPTRAWLRWAATIATFAVALWQSDPWTVFQHYGRFAARSAPDWKAAIAWVETDAHKRPPPEPRNQVSPQPVFYWAGLIEGGDHARAAQDASFREYLTYPFRGYYRFHTARAVEPILSGADPMRPGPLSAAQLQQLRSAEGGWLIYAGDPPLSQGLASEVQQQLTPTTSTSPRSQAFNGITVYRVEQR